MSGKKKNLMALAVRCAAFSFLVTVAFPVDADAAVVTGPGYSAESQTDAVAGNGTEQQESSDSGEYVFEPVPMSQLANLSSLQKKASDEELAQAYDIAVQVVAPYAGLSREEQLYGIASSLRELFDNDISYSMEKAHYNDPYGYFVLHTASCAGSTRATGLCLNILGIPYEHVNENQYSHQWCRVNIDGTYWICDSFGLYCGPEPAPYTHPYL